MRRLLLLSNSGIIAFYSNGKGDKDLIKINFVKVYTSADTQKTDILKDNIDKSGIYLWENKNNKRFYIGSSINLKRRLNSYYNLKSLAKEPTRYINNAILKEGHSAFILYILEYCSKEILLQREQHYFDLLKPSYNICPIAGSTLGLLHNEDTKNKISINKLGTNLGEDNHFYNKIHTDEAKKKMSLAKLGKSLSSDIKEKISNTMKGITFSEEHKYKLSLSKKNSKKLSVLDLRTNQETIYISISQAEKLLGLPKGSIGLNLKSKTGAPYHRIYKFLLLPPDLPHGKE